MSHSQINTRTHQELCYCLLRPGRYSFYPMHLWSLEGQAAGADVLAVCARQLCKGETHVAVCAQHLIVQPAEAQASRQLMMTLVD